MTDNFIKSLSRRQLLALRDEAHNRIVELDREAYTLGELPLLSQDEKELVREGRRIDAIKAYKHRAGCSLCTAKTIIDTVRDTP